MKQGEIVYYSDEINDEVINNNLNKRKIDKNYKYVHKNIFYRFFSFVTYNFFAKPITWFCFKFIRHIKYKNKKILKQFKKGGYFIYANHADMFSDALSPALICNPKKPRIIINSANLNTPVVGPFTPMWGGLPLPDTIEATKNFYSAIEHSLNKNAPVVIYPEAHLWPYYTKIRPFTHLSFRYPVKYNKPVFTFTTTFHKRKFSKKPRLEIYVDGPFYPNTELTSKEQQLELRNLCYNKMCERAKQSTYEFITYVQRRKDD